VPEICPVELFKVRPDGSEGETEYVRGVDPPDALIGVKAVAAVPAVKFFAATATVVDSGPA
jgi:hypothetical protein